MIYVVIYMNSGCDTERQQSFMDFNWDEFVERLFSQPPEDPMTFYMEWLTELTESQVSELLGNMLIMGAKTLFDKEIAQLSREEIDTLQKYYNSLGYKVIYAIETKEQYVPNLDKMIPVNYFQIDFTPIYN